MNELIKSQKDYKLVHILIIIVGILFLSIGLFNTNIWFDEAYSVGLANQSFIELIKVGASDVHPLLYYIILKVFTVIFGSNMIVYRLVSLIPIAILIIFGYTHIRKEFGSKVGIYFSFLLSFIPIISHYSTQIRMYTWVMLFIGLTSFYFYKVIKTPSTKNWLLFSIFSVLSAYTHHYGLFTICVINISLLIYLIITKQNIKEFIKYGVIQTLLFIPGLIVFFKQTFQVAKGFWITVEYPKIVLDIIQSSFKDSIKNNELPLIFSLIVVTYIIIRIIEMLKSNKKESYIAIVPLAIYVTVILFALTVSLVRPVFITRYMLPMITLFVFELSYILSKEKNLVFKIAVVLGILILSILNSKVLFNNYYNKNNEDIKIAIKSELQEDDIFIFKEIGAGSVVSTYFPKNKCYFYNSESWDVEQAYKAFKPSIDTVRNLEDIDINNKRIWVIDSGNSNLYETFVKNKETIKFEKIYNKYTDEIFVITLLNK